MVTKKNWQDQIVYLIMNRWQRLSEIYKSAVTTPTLLNISEM